MTTEEQGRKARKRAYNRRHYCLHNPHRIGKPRGPVPGAVKPLDEGTMRARLAAFREEQEKGMARGPRQLPAVCGFCLHEELEIGLLERTQCVLGCSPRVAGGCDRWTPRYRTEDVEDNGQGTA
ncbi:MAG: hypothetical protein ABFE13_26390 [Phycisphaerales bacterium]